MTLEDIGGPKVTLKNSQEKIIKEGKKIKTTTKENTIKILPSNVDNVKKSWVNSEWTVTKTNQTGQHSINFEENSLDRNEMKKTFSTTLKIEETLIEEWWIDTTGESQIYAYLSNKETNDAYKVYLKWINNKGWQTEKVEELYSLPNNY